MTALAIHCLLRRDIGQGLGVSEKSVIHLDNSALCALAEVLHNVLQCQTFPGVPFLDAVAGAGTAHATEPAIGLTSQPAVGKTTIGEVMAVTPSTEALINNRDIVRAKLLGTDNRQAFTAFDEIFKVAWQLYCQFGPLVQERDQLKERLQQVEGQLWLRTEQHNKLAKACDLEEEAGRKLKERLKQADAEIEALHKTLDEKNEIIGGKQDKIDDLYDELEAAKAHPVVEDPRVQQLTTQVLDLEAKNAILHGQHSQAVVNIAATRKELEKIPGFNPQLSLVEQTQYVLNMFDALRKDNDNLRRLIGDAPIATVADMVAMVGLEPLASAEKRLEMSKNAIMKTRLILQGVGAREGQTLEEQAGEVANYLRDLQTQAQRLTDDLAGSQSNVNRLSAEIDELQTQLGTTEALRSNVVDSNRMIESLNAEHANQLATAQADCLREKERADINLVVANERAEEITRLRMSNNNLQRALTAARDEADGLRKALSDARQDHVQDVKKILELYEALGVNPDDLPAAIAKAKELTTTISGVLLELTGDDCSHPPGMSLAALVRDLVIKNADLARRNGEMNTQLRLKAKHVEGAPQFPGEVNKVKELETKLANTEAENRSLKSRLLSLREAADRVVGDL